MTATFGDLALLRRFVVARLKLISRNPRAMVFTIAFPLLLVVLFSGLNGDAKVPAAGSAGGDVRFAQFYTPSIGIFGLTAACYTSLIVGISAARDSGLLKRVRGTPLPMGIYLAAWLIGAALTGIASVVVLFAVAMPAFGVHVYPRMLPAAVVTLLMGAACLAACGLMVATLVRTAEQAQPVAQLTFLPISFISGIWYPLDGAPGWVTSIAHVFPLFHIVNAFDQCFVPQTPGGGWSGNDLWAIAAWTVVAGAVATRRFRRELSGAQVGVAAAA